MVPVRGIAGQILIWPREADTADRKVIPGKQGYDGHRHGAKDQVENHKSNQPWLRYGTPVVVLNQNGDGGVHGDEDDQQLKDDHVLCHAELLDMNPYGVEAM